VSAWQFTRLGAAFMLGIACALWLLPVVFGPRMQALRLERDEAWGKVELLESEVRKLKESHQSRQAGVVVRRIHVQLEGAGDRVVLEAERRLQKQLAEQYMGRRAEEITVLLLTRRLQGLILQIDGVGYQLDVELLAVGPELGVYGTIAPLKES